MLNLGNVEVKKLTDERAIALALQCLFASMGEGASCPDIARFCSVQSAQSFSKHRAEKLVRELVAGGWVTLSTNPRNGRKTYHVQLYGVLMLAAYIKHLPLTTRDLMKKELHSVIESAREKILAIQEIL